ncbi:CAP domain-containing protein [Mesobacterium sp. TK19101]|uniref:CAP domain-containing protein n=1 Tax=Mesobacterium hydrothermale TaxID=3111907 RepID=A0ABU6HGM7_9RHOB|nr:CAP domain-containing protein [Mesobacterium sp. TK19101]MEC3860919.1 CAP domain-containing protein [Mesobacterium sp. TK19101]
MIRLTSLMLTLALAVAGCAPEPAQRSVGADGKALPRVYKITAADEARIEYRTLDGLNSLRRAAGVPEVALNAQLNAAAATHSRDMSVQNRPWHFGSDGSSPIDRVRRVGYTGRMLGENISETYESEVETLAAWMAEDDTRRVLMDPNAKDLGFAWYQEPNGKIWWTLILGG